MFFRESPLTTLCPSKGRKRMAKRGIPPFCKACLPIGREGRKDFVSNVHRIME
jgi:hypothetical protein